MAKLRWDRILHKCQIIYILCFIFIYEMEEVSFDFDMHKRAINDHIRIF